MPPRVTRSACLLTLLTLLAGAPSVSAGAGHDRLRNAGLVFPGTGHQPAHGLIATGPPGPRLEAQEGLCRVSGTQRADAARIEIGKTVGLEIAITTDCPIEAHGRADIMLAIDRSGSMGEPGKFDAAQDAVRTFLGGIDFEHDRVGLMAFAERAFVAQTLTTRLDRLMSAIDSIERPHGSTDIAAAIAAADRELAATGRSDAVAIVVLLTDGKSAEQPMYEAAAGAEKNHVVIFTIGLGPDAAHAALVRVATSAEHYYYAPGPDDLAAIYEQIAATIRLYTVTNVTITDRLSQGVSFIPGSGEPVEPARETDLTWRRGYLPAGSVSFRYRVRIARAGRVQPSARLVLEYIDGDGEQRSQAITPAVLDVVVPETHWLYLPVTWRNQCVPAKRWADVALVLDVSSSMLADDKLSRAVQAALSFVELMTLPADQAAIVKYDATAAVAQQLTGDRHALELALAGLEPGLGTRLDQGLDAAARELIGPRHRPDNRAVMVFLSDGKQIEERERVPASALRARNLGITIFTIALGEDADRGLLRDVAGTSSRAFYAPGPEALREIYGRVAGIVGCR